MQLTGDDGLVVNILNKLKTNFLLKGIFQKNWHILLYSALMAILVFSLKWLQWKYLITDNSLDIYLGLLAVFFTVFGVWIARQLTKSKTQTEVPPLQSDFELNETELQKLNLTNREFEVLQLITKGYSNAEIAESLFLSISTVKTHVSNLFVKMNVTSRIKAIEKARSLRIAP